MSEQDCQTTNSKTITAPMQFGPLVVHYVGVYDLWSGPFTSAHGKTRENQNFGPTTKIVNIPVCETGF
jgi:hypothetical protein